MVPPAYVHLWCQHSRHDLSCLEEGVSLQTRAAGKHFRSSFSLNVQELFALFAQASADLALQSRRFRLQSVNAPFSRKSSLSSTDPGSSDTMLMYRVSEGLM